MKKLKINKKIKNFNKNVKNKIDNQIKTKGKKEFIWSIIFGILIFFASAVLIFVLYIIISAPNFDKDLLYKKEATVLYDKNGVEFARVGQENRQLIEYKDLPQVYVDALIATEDSRFFQHNGLDIARFIKASFGQLLGQNAGGASTITMQLVKKTYTNSESSGIKGIIRKFTDIYMAIFKIENCYTKEEILEFYSNSLWYASSGDINTSGIYGIEQASQYFFGKSVSDLNLAEATLLVGMYQNPRLYNPFKNPVGCRNRQKIVLQLMVNHGYISEEEKDAVLKIPIESMVTDQEKEIDSGNYQVLIDYVVNDVYEKTGKNPSIEPMKIYTTFDLNIQDVLVKLENGELFKFYNDYDQEGTAITSIEDGSIVALSGGRNYKAKGLNRATDLNRQPGSTAKPLFDYAPYIEYLNGSTGDYFFDEPYTYSTGQSLGNADNKFKGLITMRDALIGSRNIPAVQAFQKVAAKDITKISDFVHSVGIDYGSTLYESASIGGFNGTNPLEMSAAYAVFGRNGYYIKPYSFTKVIYEDGTTYENKYTKEKVLSEETAYMITSMLIDTVRDTWSGNIKISGTEVAGKTGTTNLEDSIKKAQNLPADLIPDSWNITYNPEYVIALWYGYDEHSKDHYMNTNQGWNARSRIMESLSKNIYSTNKTFKKPSGVVSVEVEKGTVPLMLPSESTPEDMRMTELFKSGTEPTEVSNRYEKLESPTNGKAQYNGTEVTLSWDKIDTPKAIDTTYLQNYFNENYGQFATKYYEERISYNNSNIGKIGYEVYLENEDGSLKDLTWTEGTTYRQTLEAGRTYKFIIKSSYSIFKNNQSDSLIINVKTNTDSNIPDIIKDDNNNTIVDKDTGLD